MFSSVVAKAEIIVIFGLELWRTAGLGNMARKATCAANVFNSVGFDLECWDSDGFSRWGYDLEGYNREGFEWRLECPARGQNGK